MNKYKIYNGKRYLLTETTSDLHIAKQRAARYRSAGFKARITKPSRETSNKYGIWTRNPHSR